MKTNLFSKKTFSKLRHFKIIFLLLLLFVSTISFGQKLIISQVYEGASNDKWVEITNVGTTNIDMAAGGYKLGIWTVGGDTGNGAISGAPTSSITLSGTLTPGQSYLMRNSSASTTVPHNPMPTATTFNATVAAFNGNDALAIFTGTSTIVDAFGVGINNKDISYHRNSNILSSNTTFTVAEWTSKTLAQIAAATNTDTEYIGTHIYGVTNYSLTYSANGGSGTAPSSVSNPSGTSITLPTTTLTRSGYTFSGWNVNAAGNGTNYNAGTSYSMPAANTTLYARWAYTVTYNINGGTGTTPTAQTNYNSLTTTLNNGSGLTRTGYAFSGWKTTTAGTTADYAAGGVYTPSTGNATTTLFAHWVSTAPELTATPSTLSAFTYVEGYGPSATKSFTLTGANLDGSDVSLLPGDNYEISIDNGTTWVGYTTGPVVLTAYNGTSKAVLVRLKAGLSAGTYNNASNDIIAIEGGGDASGPIVTLSGTVTACLAPTTQSTVSSFASVGINGMTVNFTGGNGMGRVVIINKSNSFINPSNTLPAANSIYSGSGEQVIYAGTGNTVAVTGLSPSTTYYYRVYEYNICSGSYLYNTTTPTNNPRSQITACDVPVNPNGDIELDNPYCGSATLVYELSDPIQEGITYYWQAVSGGTSTTNPLVFAPGAAVANPYTVTVGGLYYVRAYNGFCWSAGSYVTGSAVVIAVGAGIATQPTNQSVSVGATATFTVTASGTGPFTYQWQESPTGLAGSWVNVGTSSNTLSLTSVPLTKNGYKYHVIVSNACTSKTSDVVTLSVNVTPVSIWSNPITGTNPGQTTGFYTTGDIKNTNITVSGISKGSGITGAAANDRYSATAWSTTTLDANDYFEFTLIPNTNYKIDFDSFVYTSQISGGASNHAFRSSLDGFISNIGTPTVSGTTISLSGAAYQNITTPITFRFYTYGVSASTRTFSINDFDFKGNVSPSCVPVTVTAFPTSGPAGTIVTITGSSFASDSKVKFGTVDADVEYISPTILKATVPATADGNIIVDTSLTCDSETAFTLIKSDITSCEAPLGGSGSGSTYASDIVIYEVYDENGGVGGVISIYNGTNATVNLANYSFFRASTYGDTYSSYGTLSGTLASGQLAVIGVSGSLCGVAPTGNGTITSGFNADDGFRLMKGATIIDDVKAPSYIGYYMRRKNTNLAPATTYNDTQWTTQTLGAGECLPADEVAQVPAVKLSPIIVTQPGYSLTCDVNTSLGLTATEGYVGGNGLTYQWYVLGTSGTWTAITNTGVYNGANSQTLNISDVTGLAGFQYYCQVRENTQTCYTATNSTQIKESTNTWASNIWSNGTPVLGSRVVIAGSYNTQVNGVLDVCDLTINTVGSVRVKPNFPVTVKKKITNLSSAANFVVESDANLIQTENVANEGNITVERQVTDMNNVTNQIDYVYWSSPVSGQLIKGATGFSPNTPSTGYLQYNEANDMFTVTNDVNFLTGKGYAIRAENGTNGYTKTYTFTGIPNNGDLQYQSLKWTNATHGFNLVGNPYPSNIDFDKLYTLNNTKIYSTAFFWTNNSYTSMQVGSGYSGNNYAIYNGTGGSPATYNPANPYDGSIIPDGKIKVGQAFIIQVKNAGKDQPLNFDNNIRVADNGNFYQKASKNRFWLTLTSPNNLVNTILLGYIPGATDSYETDFDGELFAIGSDSFYSLLGTKKLAIQGKSDNFKIDDVVTLGNVFSQNGNYTIALRTKEGIFDGSQTIYLKDKVLDKYIDLNSLGNYTFEAVKGTNNTRFEIVYKDKILNSAETKKSEFLVYRNGENFIIQSTQKLGNVEVYDAGGKLVRQIFSKENNLIIDANSLPNGVFIIKAENSGNVRTKKIIK